MTVKKNIGSQSELLMLVSSQMKDVLENIDVNMQEQEITDAQSELLSFLSAQMKDVLQNIDATMQEREIMFMKVEEQLLASNIPIAMQDEIEQKLFELKIENAKTVAEWIKKIKKIEQMMLKITNV